MMLPFPAFVDLNYRPNILFVRQFLATHTKEEISVEVRLQTIL